MKRAPWMAYAVILACTLAVAVAVLISAPTPGLYAVARGAALVGYQFAVLAVLSSAFSRRLVRTYRKPFVRLHHWLSITGLALLVAHPLLMVLATHSPAILVAAYTSGDFWANAGSPALFVFFVAAAAAFARDRFRAGWRYVHWLTYIAVVLGAIHAILHGSSVAYLPWLAWILPVGPLVALVVFVYRRRTLRPKKG